MNVTTFVPETKGTLAHYMEAAIPLTGLTVWIVVAYQIRIRDESRIEESQGTERSEKTRVSAERRSSLGLEGGLLEIDPGKWSDSWSYTDNGGEKKWIPQTAHSWPML